MKIRLDVALHCAFNVAPRPALLKNLAQLVADEAELLYCLFDRQYKIARIERRAREPGVLAGLAEAERAAMPPPPDALAVTAAACRHALASFFGECMLVGVGSFILPGWGAYIGQFVGDALGAALVA